MHNIQTKHTIDIFKHMANDLPPLADIIKKEVTHALEHLENDYTIGLEKLKTW